MTKAGQTIATIFLTFAALFLIAQKAEAAGLSQADTTLLSISCMPPADRPCPCPPLPDLTSKAPADTEPEYFTRGNFIANKYHNNITHNACFRKTRKSVILIGEGKELRAVTPFGGSKGKAHEYADAVNEYKRVFGDSVNVYCMVIPTAAEFYCPDNARQYTQSEYEAINNIYNHLSDSVRGVDVYSALACHVRENIYLRTDHHWGALGAYYAAQEFAHVAGVPFCKLENYDSLTVHDFVGTMFRFSRDYAVKRAAEDFVYYVPRNVEYSTTYTDYRLNRRRQPIGERGPRQGNFFLTYPDGSQLAYCTFIGGDTNTTKVVTSTKNGRRLLILKDSFGNALPGYLFHSFEEINIVDYRYFLRNITEFAKENNVTDILFANNNAHAHSGAPGMAYMNFLKK